MLDTGREKRDKLFNFRPVFFTAIFLCLGVAFGVLRLFYGASLWWLLLLAGLGFAFCFSDKKRWEKTAVALVVLVAAFFVGFGCLYAQACEYVDENTYEGGYFVTGTVAELSETEHGYCIVLEKITVGGNAEKGKLIAYLPAAFGENTGISDEVLLYGEVEMRGVFDEYGFAAESISRGVRFTVKDVESFAVTERHFDLFAAIRTRLKTVLYQGMDKTPAAVTLAVLTGNTDGIESGLLENMRYGGIAHVFAVSGLHVGALFAFCMLCVRKTRLKYAAKPVRFLVAAAVLLFYGGICGFSASVLRASVLCLAGYAASLIGGSVDRLEALGAAAILVLLLSPIELFCVGFQLSFLACLGIFLWTTPVKNLLVGLVDGAEKWITRLFLRRAAGADSVSDCEEADGAVNEILGGVSRKNEPTAEKDEYENPKFGLWQKWKRAVTEFLSVSLAAQLATAPVCLQAFGYLSGWSILLNCLFVPFIGAVFALLLTVAFAGCLLPTSAAAVLLYLPNVVWSAVLLAFETVDFSAFALQGITLTLGAFFCYYAALSFATDKWNLTKKQRMVFAAVCVVGCVLTVWIGNG